MDEYQLGTIQHCMHCRMDANYSEGECDKVVLLDIQVVTVQLTVLDHTESVLEPWSFPLTMLWTEIKIQALR